MLAFLRLSCLSLLVVLLVAVPGCGKKTVTIRERLTKATAVAEGPQRAAALLSVARIQISDGDPIGARDTIEAAHREASGRGEAAVPSLLEIARAFMAVGDRRSARKVLAELGEIVSAIDDPGRKAKILADAGALFGSEENGLADRQQAKSLLTQATTLAEGVDDRFRAEALAVVAMGYVNGGMNDEAAAMVEKLEACLSALTEPRAKAEALAAAASVYAKTGNDDKAATLLKDAASTARGIDRPEGKAYALLAVANAEHAAGNTSAARALLEEADLAAGKVGDADAQTTAMNTVRTAMARLKK